MISQPWGVSSGGGPRPILPASHQAPSRASSSSLWSPQWRMSGEYDSHMCAPPRSGDGPLLALRQPGQAGILAAPGLLGVAIDIGAQERLGVERPAGLAVGAPGD